MTAPDVIHANTPRIFATDALARSIRSIDYLFVAGNAPTRKLVSRQTYDARGCTLTFTDPRLLEAAKGPNTCRTANLTRTLIRSESVDAGWRIDLPGPLGEIRHDWYVGGQSSHMVFDTRLRPLACHEKERDGSETCTERWVWASASDKTINACGQLLRHDDPAGSVTYTHRSMSLITLDMERRFRVSTETPDEADGFNAFPALLEDEAWLTHQGVDSKGYVMCIVDSVGNTHGIARDVTGHVIKENVIEASGSSSIFLQSRDYDAFGTRCRETYGNEMTATHDIDPSTRLLLRTRTCHRNVSIHDMLLHYDATGNIIHRDYPIHPATSDDYAYDSIYRLIEAKGMETSRSTEGWEAPAWESPDELRLTPWSETYRHDDAGNMLELHHIGAYEERRHQSIPPDSNRGILAEPPISTQDAYDERGQMHHLSVDRTLEWNVRGQLSKSTTCDTKEIHIYNGAGFRAIKHTTTPKSHRRIRYLPYLQIHDGDPTDSCRVVDAMYTSARLISAIDSVNLRYSLVDQIGSVVAESDSSAHITIREWYRPYGETAARMACESSWPENSMHHYSGEERDASGLYYYGFRHYAPYLCRWPSPDPLGHHASPNTYQMVRSNPTSLRDILGLHHDPQLVAAAAFASFIRDGIGAFVAGATQLAAERALDALVPAAPLANLFLTVAGGMAGGIPGAIVGGAVGARIMDEDGQSPIARGTGFLLGAVSGGIGGAAPSAAGYFRHAHINTDAVRQIGETIHAFVREPISQSLGRAGPTVTWRQDPPTWMNLTTTAAADALPAIAGVLVKPFVPPLVNDLVVAPLKTATQSAAGSVVRATWGHAHSVAERNPYRPTQPSPRPVVLGGSLRVGAASLGQLAGIAAEYIPEKTTADIAKAVVEKIPDSFRYALGPTVKQAYADSDWLNMRSYNLDPSVLPSRRRSLPLPESETFMQRPIELADLRRRRQSMTMQTNTYLAASGTSSPFSVGSPSLSNSPGGPAEGNAAFRPLTETSSPNRNTMSTHGMLSFHDEVYLRSRLLSLQTQRHVGLV